MLELTCCSSVGDRTVVGRVKLANPTGRFGTSVANTADVNNHAFICAFLMVIKLMTTSGVAVRIESTLNPNSGTHELEPAL